MAITAGSAVYSGQGPSADAQHLIQGSLPGAFAQMLAGLATVTGDAASSSFDVNYIDGTKALSFTPSAILCSRSGGAATSSISVVSAAPKSGSETKAFTVTTSAAVNAATFIVAFVVIP